MPDSKPRPQPPRAPHLAGRGFTEPNRPLGEGILERSPLEGGDEDQGIYSRAKVHAPLGHGLADRARAVSVLRKAEEFMASDNPSGATEEGRRRALELACGRCGVKMEEYQGIVRGDEELEALELNVMEAARQRATELE